MIEGSGATLYVLYFYARQFIGSAFHTGFQFVGLELLLLALWDPRHMLQDPKSSLWLWKKHERKKQKKRTVNYQSYLEMMRTDGNFLSTSGDDGDTDSSGQMTKKYMAQIENFLTFGQRNLDRRQIEKLKKENERKERVGGRENFPNMKF